jgi:hypothetical protein
VETREELLEKWRKDCAKADELSIRLKSIFDAFERGEKLPTNTIGMVRDYENASGSCGVIARRLTLLEI